VKTRAPQFHSASASLAKSKEPPENTDGDPDAPKPHLEEIPKCNTLLITCAAQHRSSNKKLPAITLSCSGTV